MLKHCNIINEETKEVQIVEGKLIDVLKASEMDVEQAYNGSWYLMGYAPIKPVPTIAEQVQTLETQYQMNRWQREMILSDNSGASDFAKSHAQEIETLAEQLREE